MIEDIEKAEKDGRRELRKSILTLLAHVLERGDLEALTRLTQVLTAEAGQLDTK